jgi:hypothetical protein
MMTEVSVILDTSEVYMYNTVMYSGVLFIMELYCTPKSQFSTVKHSQKASKHTSGQSIVGLSVRLHTMTAPRRIVHH